ncbi:MAG: hypothetical protein ABSH47_03775 [Bryobacteraceae bacterium]
MHKINSGRLILAGIVAAVILDILEYVDNGIVLAKAWADSLKTIHVAPLSVRGIIAFNVWSVVVAFLAIWLYVAIRPRFGPGPKTALIAAAVVWALGWPLGTVVPLAMHVVPRSLAINASLLGIPEMAIAILAGAYLYKEGPAQAA